MMWNFLLKYYFHCLWNLNLKVIRAKKIADQDITEDLQLANLLENQLLHLLQNNQNNQNNQHQQNNQKRNIDEEDCIYLPLILDVSFVTSLAGYNAAIEYVNDHTDLTRHLKLCAVPFHPSSISDQRVFLDTMWEVANNDSYIVAVGPETSSAETAGIAATLGGFPFVSGSATSSRLEQVSLYDTFYHCAGPEEKGGFAYAYALQYYELTDIVVLAQINGEGGTSTVNIVSALLRKGKELGINVHAVKYVDLSVFDENNPGELWEDIHSTGARVIVAITNADSQALFRSALENEMTGFPYIWFISRSAILGLCCEISTSGWVFNQTRLLAYENTKLITHPFNDNTELGLLARELVDNNTEFGVGTSFRQFDAVVAIATTLGLVMDELETELGRPVTGSEMNNKNQRKKFLDIIGDISFDGSQGYNQTFDPDTHVRIPEKWAQLVVRPLTEEGLFLALPTGIYIDGEGYFHEADTFSWTPGYEDTQYPPTDPVEPRDIFFCEGANVVHDKKGIIMPDELDSGSVTVLHGDYQCDYVIDCENWADEGSECSTSLKTIEIVMGSIAGLVIVIILISSVVIIYAREWGRVRSRGTAFLFFSSLGTIIGLVSIYSLFGRASDAKCLAFPWLINLGASIVIGGLVAKQYRVFKIFLSKKFEAVIVTNADLCLFVGILMIPELILLVVLSIIDGLEPDVTEIDGKYHYVCDSDNGIVWLCLFVGYKFMLLLASSMLAVRTRKVPTAFSEGQVVGYALYNALFSIGVFVPIVASQWTSEPLLSYIILYLGILWWFSSTFFILYSPLWFGLFQDRNCDEVEKKKLPALSCSSSSGRSTTHTTS